MKDKKSLNKETIEKLSADKPSVYRIFNKKDDLLYIGSTKRGEIKNRLTDHLKNPEFKGSLKFNREEFSTIDQAKKAEKKFIQKENPKFNKQFKK